jgi:dihydroneopterin triphosphate diphosphatase
MDSPTALRPRVVDVYPYRLAPAGVPEWLLLRRAPGTLYAGTWRMVGGKVKAGEPGWRAALRELREETGRRAVRAWTLPSANVFYEWTDDRLTIAPAFAAEIEGDPVLDAEHDAFVWLRVAEAAVRLAWPEQRRLIRLADELLVTGSPPNEWLLPRREARREAP